EYADAWNTFGPPENFARKNKVLDEWCARLDRKPSQVERTVAINTTEVDTWPAYLDARAEHLIVMVGPPFDLGPVEGLLRAARD
ncbi:MAG TPA: LLM class F420-dependent oxidoreductase, partial [Acidimicrobiia bacterium]